MTIWWCCALVENPVFMFVVYNISPCAGIITPDRDSCLCVWSVVVVYSHLPADKRQASDDKNNDNNMLTYRTQMLTKYLGSERFFTRYRQNKIWMQKRTGCEEHQNRYLYIIYIIILQFWWLQKLIRVSLSGGDVVIVVERQNLKLEDPGLGPLLGQAWRTIFVSIRVNYLADLFVSDPPLSVCSMH